MDRFDKTGGDRSLVSGGFPRGETILGRDFGRGRKKGRRPATVWKLVPEPGEQVFFRFPSVSLRFWSRTYWSWRAREMCFTEPSRKFPRFTPVCARKLNRKPLIILPFFSPPPLISFRRKNQFTKYSGWFTFLTIDKNVKRCFSQRYNNGTFSKKKKKKREKAMRDRFDEMGEKIGEIIGEWRRKEGWV